MQLVDGLAEQFGHDLNFHRNLWRFDILGLPDASESAAADAANANFIIIATSHEA